VLFQHSPERCSITPEESPLAMVDQPPTLGRLDSNLKWNMGWTARHAAIISSLIVDASVSTEQHQFLRSG